jgi:glycyl-tRNA synthetase alpha chain
MDSFQDIIFKLKRYWADRGCVIQEPYDVEVGAGTMCPETFLRVLGPKPYRVAYVQPSRRPADGRYGENPNRLYKHSQLQVLLKPSPNDVIDVYLRSLESIGIDLRKHDIKFEEDNWESPTLGAWGIGWQVMLDGLEISQFTYFQQCGGIDLDLVPAELTYGLERLAAFLQVRDSIYDVEWAPGVTYADVRLQEELQYSVYNFEMADVETLWKLFELHEKEAARLLAAYSKATDKKRFPVLPAYDHVLKCSNLFNTLDSRGAISVTERVGVIRRVRKLAVGVAQAWTDAEAESRPAVEEPASGAAETRTKGQADGASGKPEPRAGSESRKGTTARAEVQR